MVSAPAGHERKEMTTDRTDNEPRASAPVTGVARPPRVQAGDDVRDFVNARGGRLYVWTTLHRCCTGGLTLLDAGVEPPAKRRSRFTVLDTDGFELRFDGGVHGLPETLVLELTRGKRKVRAYWNDRAFVE